MESIELKARLLCTGANPEDEQTKEFLRQQNPQKVLRGGLSSGLKVKLLGEGKRDLRVNFPLYSKVEVPLKVRVEGGRLIVTENGEEVGYAEILKAPDWYNQDVQRYPITSILTQHNDQVVGSVYEWCSLFDTGEQCKFCVMDKSQKNPELRDVSRKSELLLEALSRIPKESYKGIGLNGGMTFSEGRGLERVIPVINDIRVKLGINVPIAVEMTPPQDLDWIQRFADAGGNSLMMNLETWDEKTRQRLIPGKAKYCPRDSYFRAFEEALKVLGKGKVSTCFVVGTESEKSLKEGISKVVGYDVIPSPLCGRYFEDFVDYPFKPDADWREFLEVFRFARQQMAKKGLISTDCAGCVACGMCDIVGDEDE